MASGTVRGAHDHGAHDGREALVGGADQTCAARPAARAEGRASQTVRGASSPVSDNPSRKKVYLF